MTELTDKTALRMIALATFRPMTAQEEDAFDPSTGEITAVML